MDKMLKWKTLYSAQEAVVVVLFRFLQSTLMVMEIWVFQEAMALLVEEEALVAELWCIS